ncbi:MAG: DinB family protein [Phycisphaerales bacterium]
MTPEGKSIWAGLEFRRPLMMRNLEPLSPNQMRWIPGEGRVSIAWQLWHIAEVEDNWVRDLVLEEPPRFPFGVQMREATADQFPSKAELISYFHEVREQSRERLESLGEAEFDREVVDHDYGPITVREVWAGVVTSFAWHAGQIALTAKLMPNSPVRPMSFNYWQRGAWADASKTPPEERD